MATAAGAGSAIAKHTGTVAVREALVANDGVQQGVWPRVRGVTIAQDAGSHLRRIAVGRFRHEVEAQQPLAGGRHGGVAGGDTDQAQHVQVAEAEVVQPAAPLCRRRDALQRQLHRRPSPGRLAGPNDLAMVGGPTEQLSQRAEAHAGVILLEQPGERITPAVLRTKEVTWSRSIDPPAEGSCGHAIRNGGCPAASRHAARHPRPCL